MRLHLIDGTYELFRAHYSKRPRHTTPDGREVKATAGFVSSMLALLEDRAEAPTHAAVAFDNPIRSFRNELFDGYKTDEGIDPELYAQFDLVEEVAAALGLVVWSMDRHEADDALATGTRRYASDFDEIRILSPDKDLGQCLRDGVVQVDRMRRTVTDAAALIARRGVGPESVPDLLALVGDSADGIPGIPGFGEKTAAALLARFVHVDAIPDDPSDWPKGIRGADRLAETLRARREDARLYRRLATLVYDVPLAEDAAALELRGPGEDLGPTLGALGLERYLERVRGAYPRP